VAGCGRAEREPHKSRRFLFRYLSDGRDLKPFFICQLW